MVESCYKGCLPCRGLTPLPYPNKIAICLLESVSFVKLVPKDKWGLVPSNE